MRILMIDPAGAGGISHYSYALSRALALQGHQVDWITAKRCPRYETPPGLRIHRVFNGRKTNPLALWWKAWRLGRGADVVHWQSASHPELLLTVMRWLPIPRGKWFYTVHNVLPHENNPKAEQAYRQIYETVDGLIFHTHYSLTLFRQQFAHIEKPSEIIPHGEYGFLNQNNDNEGIAPDPETLLFFGNIRPYKGLDVLLQALAQLKDRFPRIRLLVAGQALQPLDPFEEIISILQLDRHVEMRIGYIPDEEIPKLLAKVQTMVLPYRSIDQSGVLLLGMAAGKTMITTCVGGIPEVIRHEQTGLLVPPDDPQALAHAIAQCIQDPDFAQQLGRAAQADVQSRFDWNAIARQTESFYRMVAQP